MFFHPPTPPVGVSWQIFERTVFERTTSPLKFSGQTLFVSYDIVPKSWNLFYIKKNFLFRIFFIFVRSCKFCFVVSDDNIIMASAGANLIQRLCQKKKKTFFKWKTKKKIAVDVINNNSLKPVSLEFYCLITFQCIFW